MKTTELLRSPVPRVFSECHGGKGEFVYKDNLEALSQEDKLCIKLINDNVIPPNSSFGIHEHDGHWFEEWYYCISGKGIMHLDGKDIEMEPGDIAVCRAGGSHGITNNGSEDLHILVVCAGLTASDIEKIKKITD